MKALDKAGTIIQHNQEKNLPSFDYDFSLEYGVAYFKGDPFLQQMRRQLSEETDKCWQEGKSHVQSTQRL